MTTTSRTNRDRRAAELRASLARQNERNRAALVERMARAIAERGTNLPAAR